MRRLLSNHRDGLTLVELLVVVTIMVLLLGVVLPLAGPALRGREVREAARQVSAYLASAQADAIASGRAVGVELTPSSDKSQCFQLAKAKEPPPYSDPTLRARFITPPNADGESVLRLVDATGTSQMVRLQALVPAMNGFKLQLDFKGPKYNGYRDTSGEFMVVLPNGIPPNTDATPINPNPRPGVKFSISVPPRRGLAAPLRLPVGAYVDLAASGFAWTAPSPNVPPDSAAFEGSLSNGTSAGTARIMFDPTGRLESFWGQVYFPGGTVEVGRLIPANPIHILLTNAKRSVAELNKSLRPDQTGIWVTVDLSGKIATTANLGSVETVYRYALHEARSKIRTSADMGGR